MRRQNGGFTLFEVILVVAISTLFAMLSFYEKQIDFEQARARQVGGFLYQYNNAVRSALSKGLVTSTTTKYGSDWLKNSTCGGVLTVGEEFLPCDFPSATVVDPIPFGRLSFSTAIVVTGTAPTKKFTATTITSAFSMADSSGSAARPRADLAGIAALSAAAAMTSGFEVTPGGGLRPFTAATDSSYKVDPTSSKITITAANNASNDAWLRTDGSNAMHASLTFDGPNPVDRMITGASIIQNFAGQTLRLGSGSALSPVTSSGVVIASGAEVLGDFRVRNSIVTDGNGSVAGSLSVGGAINSGGNISTNSSLIASGNGSIGGSLSVGAGGVYSTGNVSTPNNMIASGNVNAGGAMYAQLFVDANDGSYYVDPNGVSNFNSIYGTYIESRGRVRANEYVEITGVAVEGTGCSPNGLMGRNAAGALISCQNGQWKLNGGIGLSQQQSGICQPAYVSSMTCVLPDASWYCTLSGVSGAGEEEDGYVYLSGNNWYLYAQRGAWPARYRWTCFK